jgi:hypothetical protein
MISFESGFSQQHTMPSILGNMLSIGPFRRVRLSYMDRSILIDMRTRCLPDLKAYHLIQLEMNANIFCL